MDLSRFIDAHMQSYENALREIRQGRKTSHWMWYIFPQLKGLGRSSTAQYYGIEGAEEATAFLKDPYLGENLSEICTALLELDTNNPTEVFGKPDDMKLRSSMTLFAQVAEDGLLFQKVLNKYYDGRPDKRTIKMLEIL